MNQTSRVKKFVFIGVALQFAFFLVRIISKSSLIFDQLNLCGVFIGLIFIRFRFKTNFLKTRNFETLLMVVVMVFISQNIYLNIDRSRSFYVLSWISKGEIISTTKGLDLQNVKSTEAENKSAILQRIVEQKSRGLIKKEKNTYKLTEKGNLILNFSELIGKIYDLRGWKMNRV